MIQQEKSTEFQRVRDEIGERIKRFSETGSNKERVNLLLCWRLTSFIMYFIYLSFRFKTTLKNNTEYYVNMVKFHFIIFTLLKVDLLERIIIY